MANPPNYTGDPKGFNTRMFKSDRAVRRAFMILGYGINRCVHKVPRETVEQFQKDFNVCGQRFSQWGSVTVNGALDKPTLNALEHAVRWSKRRESRDGMPSATSWQSLCRDRRTPECGECDEHGRPIIRRKNTNRTETKFVEVTAQGTAKLRDMNSDVSLRAELIDFERDGDVVFAVVKIPPQADLSGGRDKPFRCPCVLAR